MSAPAQHAHDRPVPALDAVHRARVAVRRARLTYSEFDPAAASPPEDTTERDAEIGAGIREDHDMAVGFSLSQQRLDPKTRKASKPGRRGRWFGGRAIPEPTVELTVRRRPAGKDLGSPLAKRIHRQANPPKTVRVPLSQKGRARRDLDRSGWRVERERIVRR